MLHIEQVAFAPAYLPYADGLQLQRSIHSDVVARRRDDTLLLLEHEAVYTAGKRTQAGDLPTDGTPVVEVDRGGRITWHGPGQLVGYPIVRLPEPIDVVAHVRRLEQLLIDVLSEHGVDGVQVEGRSGVWVHRAFSTEKIAAIGVRVERGVTLHGFAVNCDNALEPFSRIVPCGIADAGVTTASVVTGTPVSPAAVAATVSAVFAAEYAGVAA